MISNVFHLAIYQPLYNGLIFLMDTLPWIDAGVAVIIFTFLVKLALFPLSRTAVKTQLKMKESEVELAKIKEKYKTDREGQARATMAYYKEKGINPFSSILLLFIQIPIIFGLYYVFRSGLPVVQTEFLYSFVKVPSINMLFLGLLDITKGSLILALCVGITQHFQVRFSMPVPKTTTPGASLKDDMARTLNWQMRYFLPVVISVVAYSLSGALSLYWITSNLFAIGQELVVRNQRAV